MGEEQRQDLTVFVRAVRVLNRALRSEHAFPLADDLEEGEEVSVTVSGGSDTRDEQYMLRMHDGSLEIVGRRHPEVEGDLRAEWQVAREDLRAMARDPRRYAAEPRALDRLWRRRAPEA